MPLLPTQARTISQYDRIYVGVDDTGSAATEAVAQEIADRFEHAFDVRIHMGITGHQLLQGSSFCFDIDLPKDYGQRVYEIAGEAVWDMCGADADPGLCVLTLRMEDDGLLEDVATHAEKKRQDKIREAYDKLIRFAQRAKREMATVEEAREAAAFYPEIFLDGTGTAGRGMIGALAGVGLRVGGDDGMFCGEYDMTCFSIRSFGAVAQCIGGFRDKYGIDPVIADRTGSALGFHDRINLIPNAKPVLNAGCFTLLCTLAGDDMWTPYTKDDFGKGPGKRRSCDYFELDPDEEERFRESKRRSCSFCLYRKLTSEGFVCSAGHEPVR